MFLADYHIHSTCSPDAFDSMADMALAAFERGMNAVCFTDHCDFTPDDGTMQLYPGEGVFPRQLSQLQEARERAPAALELSIGLELGEGNHDPERAVGVYAIPGYDFILGSLHNLKDTPDFYWLKYRSEEQCHQLYDLYLDELIDLSSIPCFDVLAHLGYCRRYMAPQGFSAAVTLERDGDKVETILKNLIHGGRGLELNCADLVPGGREHPLLETFPSLPILRRYRELGGELITVGSDAHLTQASGLGIAEGYELLREAGFSYVTVYHGHRPEFIKI